MSQITIEELTSLLASILPSVVTVITLVITTIIQVSSSRRETDRIIANNKHLEELERVRAEEARKATLSEKQIASFQRTHEKMIELYCSMNDSLCDLALDKQTEQAALAIRSDATKLISMCKPDTDLYRSVQDLAYYFEPDITSDFSKAHEYHKNIHWRICDIGKRLSSTTLMNAIADGTFHTEMHTQ